jgi:hypothetical protein
MSICHEGGRADEKPQVEKADLSYTGLRFSVGTIVSGDVAMTVFRPSTC